MLEVIQKYAFVVSDFPMILSFEIHCSPEQQVVMSNMIVEIFRESLYAFPANSDALPLLGDLTRKTLIKAKIFQFFDDDYEEDGITSNPYTSSPGKLVDSLLDIVSPNLPSLSSKSTEDKLFKRRKATLKREFLKLVNLKTRTFSGFELARDSFQFDQMSSIGERRSANLALKERLTFIKHNARFMTRIYPSSLRINSSNFDPVIHWKSGCQVSLAFLINR